MSIVPKAMTSEALEAIISEHQEISKTITEHTFLREEESNKERGQLLAHIAYLELQLKQRDKEIRELRQVTDQFEEEGCTCFDYSCAFCTNELEEELLNDEEGDRP